jgi:hypothetical protein
MNSEKSILDIDYRGDHSPEISSATVWRRRTEPQRFRNRYCDPARPEIGLDDRPDCRKGAEINVFRLIETALQILDLGLAVTFGFLGVALIIFIFAIEAQFAERRQEIEKSGATAMAFHQEPVTGIGD